MQPIVNIFRRLNYVHKGLLVLLTLLLVATIALATYLVYTVVNLRQLLDQGTNAATTTIILQDLEIQIEATESAQRGYVITGNELYLQPYYQALEIIPQEEKSLTSSASSISNSDLKTLDKLIDQKLAQVKQTIATRKEKGFTAAVAQMQANSSNNLTQAIQNKVSSLALQKVQHFQPSYQKTQTNISVALFVTGIVVSFVFIMCGLIIRYFQRTIQEQQAVEGSKNEFLSLASHQLRTPATNVKQYLGMLKEGYMGKLTDEQLEAINIADRSNDMGISIVNALLGVAKLDLNEIKMDKKLTDLYELCCIVDKGYRARLKEKRQTLTVLKPKRRIKAPVDRTHLASAIENLLDNAHKYCPTGCAITISLAAQPSRQTATIAIHDEGPGMPKKSINKIFNKFSRLDTDNTTRVEGSGLGLYWVKRVIELHGGSIQVKSQLGEGSTFTITLPTTS